MAQNTVAIVGVGTVGSQVAQLAAEAGWTVIGIEKDAPTAEAAAQRSGVEVGTDLEAAAEAAIVIECLPEKRDLKHAVFAQIGGLAADDAVLVTTATALSVTDLALSSGRPNRVLGLSLPHDPARTQLELVRPDFADQDALDALFFIMGFLALVARCRGSSPTSVAKPPWCAPSPATSPTVCSSAT